MQRNESWNLYREVEIVCSNQVKCYYEKLCTANQSKQHGNHISTPMNTRFRDPMLFPMIHYPKQPLTTCNTSTFTCHKAICKHNILSFET